MDEINEALACKVLEVVDAGLVSGLGSPVPGSMCVEAAVCFAMGLPHSDEPTCVSPALRSLKIRLNDSWWSSNTARANGLRRLALAQLGSAGVLDDKEFAKRVSVLAIKKIVPLALRAAASIQKNEAHKLALLSCADECETEPTEANARKARNAANAALAAANAALAAANAASASAAYADNAAYAAANAAYAAATAANAAATAANAANAADNAAYAAAYAAANARDKILGEFAEDVVSILKDMNAPGCQWLYLTEKEAA